MAEEQKKSFLVYFDMYPSIHILPIEQKGMLLDAMFEYAQAAAKQEGSPETVLARCPDMSQACCMAFRFVAETIRRDTEKWRDKHKRYSEAAKTRWEKGHGQSTGESGYSKENNAWMRKYIQQRQEERKETQSL